MNDPFHSSKYSLERAKHHIADLERHFAAFIKSDPYSQVVEIDPNTAESVHKIKLTKPMPVALEGIAVDAVQNLRNALDQAVYALKLAGRDRFTYFPFANDAVKFEEAINGRCKKLPKEIVDLLRSFKPHKGGDNLLWALNELCNTNKHGIICPMAILTGDIHFRRGMLSGGAMPMPVWDRTKNEMTLCRVQRAVHLRRISHSPRA